MAGDCVKEMEAPPALAPAKFPKTQATQTDQPDLQEKIEVEEKKNSGRVWSWFRGLVGWILVLVIMVSLVAEVEYEGRLYRPITYYPLRYRQYR